MKMQTPPSFSEVSREEAEVELDRCDMYVRYEGWEYYLGKANGPSHPHLDLSDYCTSLHVYDEKVVVVREIPEDGQTWEVVFRPRNVYPAD